MIEPRIYRAAFLPAVLALLIAMFSLGTRPPALTSELAADILFDGDSVAATAQELANDNPDRRPGTAGSAATADDVAAAFEQAGFDVQVDEFSEGDKPLTNVIGRRSGALRDQIVLLAPRDADSVPDLAGSAADTAALLELAGSLEGRASRKTLVLASVDGSTLGDAGARRFAETVPDRERIQAILALSDLGARGDDGPSVVAWSGDESRVSIGLERTVVEALRGEVEDVPSDAGLTSQFSHLALPLGIGSQGELLTRDLEAVRLSGSGELPPEPSQSSIDVDTVGVIGRAALQSVSALDEGGGPEHGPPAYLTVGDGVMAGWIISVVALTLILPVLIASVDAFARARRRRVPVGRWAVWLAAGVVPFALGLGVAFLLVLSGQAPDAPAAPEPPSAQPFDGAAAASLGLVAAAIAIGLILARPLLARRGGPRGDVSEPGAACVVALALSVTALCVWVLNPYAALAIVPAVHLWMLATLGESPRPAGTRALLVLGGVALPVAVALFYLGRLSLNPLEGLWYLFLLVTGGGIGILQALLGCVLLGIFASVISIVVAQRRRPVTDERRGPAVRGPGGYAGPGSLGGTESALKR